MIPHVSSLKTPKEMFDALSRLYEGKNINRKMTLRAQLKECEDARFRIHSIILHKSISTQGADRSDWRFSRGSRTSDDYNEWLAKTMGSIHQGHLFSKEAYEVQRRLWEDCTREEARLEAREEKLGQEENQALTVQARKGKEKVERSSDPEKIPKVSKEEARRSNPNISMLQMCRKAGTYRKSIVH